MKSVESGGKQHAEMALKRFSQQPSWSRIWMRSVQECAFYKLELAKAGTNWWIVKRGLAQAGNRAGKIARHNICGRNRVSTRGMMRSFSHSREQSFLTQLCRAFRVQIVSRRHRRRTVGVASSLDSDDS